MLFGAIGFSYANFNHTRKVFERTGKHSANLGDNMQSLAVRHLYRQLGIPETRIVTIDRDRLAEYDGPTVVLPMNAVFRRSNLPVSDRIIPVFFGFHASGDTMNAHRGWLARQGHIGCRDPATADALIDLGISAYVTGCLTCSLPARAENHQATKVVLAQGAGNGAFPKAALAAMPPSLRDDLMVVKQRRDMVRLPLTAEDMEMNDRAAEELLSLYQRQARLVVTSLHHAASPCIAAGIPVVLVRESWDKRFGFLKTLMPVHLGPDYSAVDWFPAPVAMDAVKARQLHQFKEALTLWL